MKQTANPWAALVPAENPEPYAAGVWDALAVHRKGPAVAQSGSMRSTVAALLQAEGPLASYEIAERLGWSQRQVVGAVRYNPLVRTVRLEQASRPSKRRLTEVALIPRASSRLPAGAVVGRALLLTLQIRGPMFVGDLAAAARVPVSSVWSAALANPEVFKLTPQDRRDSTSHIQCAVYAYVGDGVTSAGEPPA